MDLYRQDAGSLGQAERTPQGGYRVPAVIASAGVLEYVENGRTVREYTPPAVLEAAAASLRDAPVTVEHPPRSASTPERLITPANYAEHTQGNTTDVSFDGRDLHGALVVQGSRGVAYLSGGARGVSAGYTVRVDETPGTTPEGEPYDRVRTALRFNHTALVRSARQSRARVVLDSAGHQLEENDMPDTAELQQEIGALKVRVDSAEAATTAEKTRADSAEAARDVLQAQVDELKAKLAAASDPARLDSAVTERVTLLAQAAKLAPKAKLEGLDSLGIKRAVLAEIAPTVKLDGRDEVYVSAAYDVAIASDPNGHKQLAQLINPPARLDSKQQPVEHPTDAARKAAIARRAEDAKAPLAHRRG